MIKVGDVGGFTLRYLMYSRVCTEVPHVLVFSCRMYLSVWPDLRQTDFPGSRS